MINCSQLFASNSFRISGTQYDISSLFIPISHVCLSILRALGGSRDTNRPWMNADAMNMLDVGKQPLSRNSCTTFMEYLSLVSLLRSSLFLSYFFQSARKQFREGEERTKGVAEASGRSSSSSSSFFSFRFIHPPIPNGWKVATA